MTEQTKLKDSQAAIMLVDLYHQLELQIDQLIIQLSSDSTLRVAGYETQPVSAEQQEYILLHGQQHIKVENHSNNQIKVLDYFKRFHAASDASTRFVSRMPGVIQTNIASDNIIGQIQSINQVKDQIKHLVQIGRNHYQRHEFIHQGVSCPSPRN